LYLLAFTFVRSEPWGEQVATDTRLWLFNQLQLTRGYLADLIKAAVARAESEVDVLMPGFTHLQPAQTVRMAVVALFLIFSPLFPDRPSLHETRSLQLCTKPAPSKVRPTPLPPNLSLMCQPGFLFLRFMFCLSSFCAFSFFLLPFSFPSLPLSLLAEGDVFLLVPSVSLRS
jgi:Lyase